jgi:uncharacterized GH25 family protein
MVARIFIGVAFLLAFIDTHAQEFWMMPDKFQYERGDTIKIRFNVGENFVGETWNLRPERLKSVSLHTSSGPSDILSQVKTGRGDHLLIPAVKEGTYLVTMEGENAFVELPAERFNAYLKEHALDNVAALRKKANKEDQPGREMYRRITNLIVQVGDTRDDTYKKVTGAPLQIIPTKHPLDMKKGDLVQFKILFNGKPDFGARVYVWNNKDNKVFNQPIYSQQDGTIDVRIFNDGDWMISVVKMIPVSNPKADWQSFWGSLVFHVNE